MTQRQHRRERERSDLKREIVDAARALFVVEGYENFSMRKVATRIGYSPTTIYLYFRDKSELLGEVCEDAFRTLTTRLRRRQNVKGNSLTRLRRGMTEYIKFGLEHPHHYEVAFILPNKVFFGPMKYEFRGSAGEEAFSILSDLVADCIAAGEFREKDATLAAQALWAAIHGVTSVLITHKGFPFVGKQKLSETVVDTMINGLRN